MQGLVRAGEARCYDHKVPSCRLQAHQLKRKHKEKGVQYIVYSVLSQVGAVAASSFIYEGVHLVSEPFLAKCSACEVSLSMWQSG
jgi:hypothetical protein